MATVMKTPGVYIVEKNAFPNSVVEVATAVPVFIGYTQIAMNKGTSLSNKPWRISSMAEFITYYGGAPAATFTVTMAGVPAAAPPATGGKTAAPAKPPATPVASAATSTTTVSWDTSTKFLLYYSMLLFFANGGGPCYVVSVGSYGGNKAAGDITAGIDLLLKEQEPTMIVIPDAVLLSEPDCIKVQQAALEHCGLKTKSRVAILDIYNGWLDRNDSSGDCVATFRNDLGINNLDYGAAYYPWVNTSVVDITDLGYQNISNLDPVKSALQQELTSSPDAQDTSAQGQKKLQQRQDVISALGTTLDPAKLTPDILNNSLTATSPIFVQVLTAIQKQMNLLPPSAAIAGVYTSVDDEKGVWKAPANVSLNNVVSPAVPISDADQEDLNVTVQGKSVNAIRAFVGEGTLVWGARTLDGNSLDWRYINVRRTMIMLEQSIKLATKAYVFENNVSTTWITIKSMIANFLTSVWKRGGLAGATPEDAFSVFCGLGETMTADDILEGILRVTVLVAVTHPAEFIEITFQQQMQKS
jgi:phage tail sheath protein FI